MPMSGSTRNTVGSHVRDAVIRPDRTAELEALQDEMRLEGNYLIEVGRHGSNVNMVALSHTITVAGGLLKEGADRIDALEALLHEVYDCGHVGDGPEVEEELHGRIAAALKATP
jgi:hypothetical protein